MLKYIGLGAVLTLSASFALAVPLSEGVQYTTLAKPIAGAPEVVEFFSFYCPPCAAFAGTYKVSEAIDKRLPDGTKIEKYHVSAMGAMGKSLTEAWSVAKALGVELRVETMLFAAVQTSKTIHSDADIRQVFLQAGISADEYDAAKNSFVVKALTEKQEQAAEQFGVTGTPSFFVKGKYLVRNNGIGADTVEHYAPAFAEVVSTLIKKK
ncbi:TPA: DsbA family protein [Klebsiella aerogenes]